MENGILVALSRQAGLRRQLDIVANNVANLDTTAFKGESLMFVEHMVRTAEHGQKLGEPIAFVRDVASVRDLSEGTLKETGNDLDVAISGDGYFAVQTPFGARYTRDGHFRLDEQGQLVTAHGIPLETQSGTPITLSPQDTQIVIARDGTVSSEIGPLDKLKVVRFERPQDLQAVEGGLLQTEDSPQDVTAPVLVQGKLEGSNVQPVLEMARLIEVHRSYEQVSSLVDREDDRLRKMLQTYAA